MVPEKAVEEIVATIVQLELVEPAKEQAVRTFASQCTDVMEFYRVLVREGLLTAYQVNALANGRAHALVLGPYCLLERLGQGSVSEVFKARHRALGRVCALKVIGGKQLADAALIHRFFAQAQIAARLNHPNIVIVYDAGQDGARYYYAMEYLEAKTLAQLVQQRGALPVPMACEYVRQAAHGLQHATELGLIHRNLKPWNLVLSRDPQTQSDVVKVLDFGLADVLAEGLGQQSASTSAATAALDYAAPELFTSPSQADVRADIYSLGCTLYYLLTGRPPTGHIDPTRKLAAKTQGQLQPIGELRRDLPPGLVNVLDKMLATRPQDRYKTPSEVAQALAPFALGASLSPAKGPTNLGGVPPPVPIPPAARARLSLLIRRKHFYWLLGLALTFVFGVALAIFLVFALVTKPSDVASQPGEDKKPPDAKPPAGSSTAASPPASDREEVVREPVAPEIPPGIPSIILQAPTPTGRVNYLAIDPYGDRVAVLEAIGQVNIYNAADAKLRVSFPLPNERTPLGVTWCGQHSLAVVYLDGVEWREASRGQLIGETLLKLSTGSKPKLSMQPLAYSPYASVLAFPWDKSLVLADAETLRYTVYKGIPPNVLALACAERAGVCWILGQDGLYKAEGTVQRLDLPQPELDAETLPVGTISPNGLWAAQVWRSKSGTKSEYIILVWSLFPPAQVSRIKTPARPEQLAFIPVTRQLAVLYPGTVLVVYDLPQGEMSLVVRSAGKLTGLAAAHLAPRLAVCEESGLYAVVPVRDWAKPQPSPVAIVSEPTDPPAIALGILPMPLPGQERQARAALLEKYRELYAQLPQSRLMLQPQLLEHLGLSTNAEEVLACGLEIARLSGAAGDVTGIDLAVRSLQDRFAVEAVDLRRLVLSEFSRPNVPASVLPSLVTEWERLAEAFVARLDFVSAIQCCERARDLAQGDPKLSVSKVPPLNHRITLYKNALADKEHLQPALAALEKNPDDPQAHKVLGIFYIRRLEDYGRGFGHLLRCHDAPLVKLAQMELAGPKKIEEMVQLADAWVEVGQPIQPAAEARWYYERAVYWYQQAYAKQLQENAVLASAIAERWKKNVARFGDLPVPSITGFLRQHQGPFKMLTNLSVAGDKIVLVGRAGDDPCLAILDRETYQESARWKLPSSARWLAGCPSQRLAAVGLTDGSFFWLDAHNSQQQPKRVYKETISFARGVFTDKGDRLVALTSDRLFIFRAGLEIVISEKSLSSPPRTGASELVIAPNGQRLLVAGRSSAGTPQLMLLNLDGQVLDSYTYAGKGPGLPLLAFTSDGSFVAAAWQKEVTLFRVPAPGPGEKLVPDYTVATPSAVRAITHHPHQGQLVLGLEDGSLALLRIEDKKLTVFKGISDQPICAIAVHPEARRVIVGYQQGLIGEFSLP